MFPPCQVLPPAVLSLPPTAPRMEQQSLSHGHTQSFPADFDGTCTGTFQWHWDDISEIQIFPFCLNLPRAEHLPSPALGQVRNETLKMREGFPCKHLPLCAEHIRWAVQWQEGGAAAASWVQTVPILPLHCRCSNGQYLLPLCL